MAALTALSLPIPWGEFEFPSPVEMSGIVLIDGEIGWSWDVDSPEFALGPCSVPSADKVPEGWGIDHIVLMVPALDDAIETFEAIGVQPRLKTVVRERRMAFYRAGTVIEVIESPVRSAALYGIALTTDESLEVLALRWRGLGHEVTDPKPAIQEGRRIMTVRGLGSGMAVMSPDRAR